MKKFHGTPIGGSRQDAARFLIGRDALVPFPRQDDMGIVGEVCRSFVLDNGAFSTFTRGQDLDVPGFTRWVEELHRHPRLEWALIPDTILGDESDNDALLRDWPDHLRDVGVPVWHMHESPGRLQRLCREWRTVALGSSGQWRMPGTAAWWARMAEAMAAICDEAGRPAARLHGLRMLDPDIFRSLPLASADSTNAAVNCGSVSRFGMYPPATSSQRAAVIADRIERENSPAVWERRALQTNLLEFG